jgi:hypothetical protein
VSSEERSDPEDDHRQGDLRVSEHRSEGQRARSASDPEDDHRQGDLR